MHEHFKLYQTDFENSKNVLGFIITAHHNSRKLQQIVGFVEKHHHLCIEGFPFGSQLWSEHILQSKVELVLGRTYFPENDR